MNVPRPDHEPGPDCPNVPHTCVICEPKRKAVMTNYQLVAPGGEVLVRFTVRIDGRA